MEDDERRNSISSNILVTTDDNDDELRIIPSEKLINFILTLKDEKYIPKNIHKIIQNYKNEKNYDNIQQQNVVIEDEIFDNHQINLLQDLENFSTNHEENNQIQNDNIVEYNRSLNLENDNEIHSNLSSFLDSNDIEWIKETVNKYENQQEIEYLDKLLEINDKIIPTEEDVNIENFDIDTETKTRFRKIQKTNNCVNDEKELEDQNINNDDDDDDILNEDNDTTKDDENSLKLRIRIIIYQLLAILQFILSIIGGFIFGFIIVELIIGTLDYGFRLLLGVIFALIVALSEIYFLAKKLVEYDDLLSPIIINEKEKMD